MVHPYPPKARRSTTASSAATSNGAATEPAERSGSGACSQPAAKRGPERGRVGVPGDLQSLERNRRRGDGQAQERSAERDQRGGLRMQGEGTLHELGAKHHHNRDGKG